MHTGRVVMLHTCQVLIMLYPTGVKVKKTNDLISLFCHVNPVHWLWGSWAAVVLATWHGPATKVWTNLPHWAMPSLHSQSDCCLYNMFFLCSSLCFMSHPKYYWVKITYALFDHCCHHGTVLKKKICGEKKLWSLLAITCKKKSNVIIRKDFKMLPFLVQKRNLWREPQQWGMCYCVGPDNDLLEIY